MKQRNNNLPAGRIAIGAIFFLFCFVNSFFAASNAPVKSVRGNAMLNPGGMIRFVTPDEFFRNQEEEGAAGLPAGAGLHPVSSALTGGA